MYMVKAGTIYWSGSISYIVTKDVYIEDNDVYIPLKCVETGRVYSKFSLPISLYKKTLRNQDKQYAYFILSIKNILE